MIVGVGKQVETWKRRKSRDKRKTKGGLKKRGKKKRRKKKCLHVTREKGTREGGKAAELEKLKKKAMEDLVNSVQV